jgi:S-layer protein
MLTSGVDTIAGSASNDTVNAVLSATAANVTLNAFDSIDGAAGDDTLNIASTTATNFTLPASTTFANLETVNVSHAASGGTGTGAVAITDSSFGSGVKVLNYIDASAAADMTAATAAVTLNSATDVTVKATGTGTFTTVAVTDTSTTAASTGSTLKNVTVEKASGALTLTGNAIDTVNLNATGGLTTITAAAAARALTLNTTGTTALGGVTDATATSVSIVNTGAKALGTITTAAATEVNMTTTGATSATIAASAATTMTFDGTALNTVALTAPTALTSLVVKGSGGVVVNTTGAAALTSIDSSASTAVAPASGVATGANSFTIGTTTAVTGGAGSDNVTVGATTKAIALAAGDDTATVSVTALGVAGTIDGGEGTDTLVLSNANAVTLSAAGAVQTAFKAAVTGFETLNIGTAASSTISMSGFGDFNTVALTAAAQTQVISGVTTGKAFNITEGVALTSLTTNNLSGSADTMTIGLLGDLSAGPVAFGTVTTPGVETMTINTVDSNATHAATLATVTVVDADLSSLIITGNNGVALTHAGTALTSLDASGLTKGGVTYTSGVLTTDVTATGSLVGNDTIDLSAATSLVTITETAGTNALTGSATNKSTITGGSGVDTITGGAAVDTLTGGAGADVFTFAVGDSLAGTSLDVITDFNVGNVGDELDFAATQVLLAADATGLVATTNVNTTAGGKVSFATADDTYAEKVAAIQADAELDVAESVAFFEDSGNTYVYTAGATTGEGDDQIVQLTGVTGLTTITITAGDVFIA